MSNASIREHIRSHIGPPEEAQERAVTAEIIRLRKLGWSRDGIARRLGLHPDRVGVVIGLARGDK
jgi:hypothetical protein